MVGDKKGGEYRGPYPELLASDLSVFEHSHIRNGVMDLAELEGEVENAYRAIGAHGCL